MNIQLTTTFVTLVASILATTMSLAAPLFTTSEFRLGDSFPRDTVPDYSGGVGGNSNYAGFNEGSGVEDRGFFEFDISGISGGVSSATFSFGSTGYRIDSVFSLYAYTANGALDFSDWNAASTFVSQQPAGSTIPIFDITSALNAAVVRGDSYFGMRLQGGPEVGDGYGLYSGSSYTPANNLDRPRLDFTVVPEPNSYTLIIVAGLLLPYAIRKMQTKPNDRIA